MTEQADDQGTTFGEILAAYEQTETPEARKEPSPGEKVSGKVLSITDESVFIDLGAKAEGVIATSELKDKEGKVTVAVGDTIEATVSGIDPASGAVQLHKKLGARGKRSGGEVTAELREAFEHQVPVEGLVTGFNKGGAEVKLLGVRAFCPTSQLDIGFVKEALPYVGQKLTFRVLRLEEGKTRPNVVLSRRVLLEEEQNAKAAELRKHLTPGTVVKGKVTSIAAYGAFVDIGGVEGLLHVSEIQHSRLAHPNEVLTDGQEVEVQITKIEPGKDGRDRISLSRKALASDPWREATSRFKEGEELDGIVKRLESFGAFVEIAPGIEGLLHISEIAKAQPQSGKGGGGPKGARGGGGGGERRLNHAREGLQLGQSLRVRVLGVDSSKRRISLGTIRDEEHHEIREAVAQLATAKPQGNFGAMADFFKKAGLKE